MRVPLGAYLHGGGAKVYSLVVGVPFSPLDIDLGYLARGEWNALADRFRVWYIPKEDGVGPPVCYVMVRKFDKKDDVVVYGHMVVNMEGRARGEDGWAFIVGVMSNDEVRARVTVNSMLGIPPSYHRRSELQLIERRWRGDPGAVMRFSANVHSAMSQPLPDARGKAYTLKFDSPSWLLGELKRDLGAWWGEPV